MKNYLTMKNLLVLIAVTRLIFHIYSFCQYPNPERGLEVLEGAIELFEKSGSQSDWLGLLTGNYQAVGRKVLSS